MNEYVLLFWFVIGIMSNALISWLHSDGDNVWITPINVYRDTELNWFGSLCIYMVMFAINPFWYITKLIVWILFGICNFIWWILHVGRETNDAE